MGLLVAASQIKTDFQSTIEVNYTIRKEAFACEENLLGQNSKKTLKPGDADNEEPENGGGNNDADLPPEREEAPSEYENDGNTATIRYGELKTLGAESRYEEIKMLNGMKDNVLSVGFVLLIP